MLELKDVTLQLDNSPDAQMLLAEVGARFPRRHFAAILGPSGCGKSTLLKVIAGLREPTLGHLAWKGRDLAEEDMDPHEIGYVPQFSIAYDLLTVFESVDSALRLRVSGLSAGERDERIETILKEVGLEEIADREVRVLSGGQKRRLAMALEMVSAPHLLLCDEVTSGLDPKAEDEITRLMHQVSRRNDRIVLSVTHSLRHLGLYDSVVVLYQGHLAYHGASDYLFHYFGVEKPEELFPRLAQRKPEDWHRSWLKHREAYYAQSGLTPESDVSAKAAEAESHATLEALQNSPHTAPSEPDAPSGDDVHEEAKDRLKALFEKLQVEEQPAKSSTSSGAAVAEDDEEPAKKKKDRSRSRDHHAAGEEEATELPSPVTQFFVLLGRRWKLFLRDRAQLGLQIALLVGFPLLVVIFAHDGLPQIHNLDGVTSGNAVQQIYNQFTQEAELMRTGSLVSGLIMFQVVLLALTGSNNAAREIAGERLIFEKEKFAGLRPSSYVASKAVFLGALVLAQSVWMAVFVNFIVHFPGSLGTQILLLTLLNGALTAVCLGISSVLKTAEQASLVSIYLVGFQLPLSGAVLALPAVLSWVTRPFIASYWAWSGFVHTLHDTRFYESVLKVTKTHLSAEPLCVWVLACHIILGLLLSYTGCKNSRWE